jgi:acetylornithine deacetylase
MNFTTDDNLIEFAFQLVCIPSNSGMEQDVLKFVEQIALQDGFQTLRNPVDATRWNLLIHSQTTHNPDILYSTHVDTVPGGPSAKLEDGVLHGRGSCDAKGIAAAMYYALRELPEEIRARTGLLLVVGEETTSDGAKVAARTLPKCKYIINGEPTEMQWVKAQRGVLSLSLNAQGTPAHSGYPQWGHSALDSLLDSLHRIRNQKWPADSSLGETLVNVGVLHGGVAANVLAPHASAEVMMRIVTAPDAIEPQVKNLLDEHVTMEIRSRSEPQHLETPENEQTVVVGFGSDVPHLRPLGTPLMMGPGSIRHAHTDNEHILCTDLLAAKNSYIKAATQLFEKIKKESR